MKPLSIFEPAKLPSYPWITCLYLILSYFVGVGATFTLNLGRRYQDVIKLLFAGGSLHAKLQTWHAATTRPDGWTQHHQHRRWRTSGFASMDSFWARESQVSAVSASWLVFFQAAGGHSKKVVNQSNWRVPRIWLIFKLWCNSRKVAFIQIVPSWCERGLYFRSFPLMHGDHDAEISHPSCR